jgi:hypothetical protein
MLLESVRPLLETGPLSFEDLTFVDGPAAAVPHDFVAREKLHVVGILRQVTRVWEILGYEAIA